MAKERFLNFYANGKWWKKKFLGYDDKNRLKLAKMIIEKQFPEQYNLSKVLDRNWKIVSYILGKPPFFLIKGRKILMYEDAIISELEMDRGQSIIGARATANGLVVITKSIISKTWKIITIGIVNNQLKKLSESSCDFNRIWIGYHSYNKPFSKFHQFKDVSNSSLPIGYNTDLYTDLTKVYTIDDNGYLMPPVEYDNDEFGEFKNEIYHLNNLDGDPILVKRQHANALATSKLKPRQEATAFWWTYEEPIEDLNIEDIVRD